ncbi:hypothetical protein CL634_05455 [bacterium]|nr:hypothetical protein [bacterium]
MDQQYIAQLSNMVAYQMRELLVCFDVPFEDQDNLLVGVCPIHDGADNPHAFTVDLEEGDYFGCWRCWTRGCEKEWLHSPIGLIRAILSTSRGKKVSFNESVRFALEFIKLDKEDIYSKSQNIRFGPPAKKKISLKIPREKVRSSLARPVRYYLDRGYGENVLDIFDVGACWEKGKPMYGRAVAPVYDEDFKHMVGCVGRTMHENFNGNKWINSKHFNSGSHLYGYWLAKEGIRKTQAIILVEGQGDVWRLWEAGIKNAVGIFGSSLSDAQCRTVETCGALNIISLMDNDEAGAKARISVKEKCERLFNIIEPLISKKDVGDMTVKEITTELKPQLKEYI